VRALELTDRIEPAPEIKKIIDEVWPLVLLTMHMAAV
jgi:hypothetical protein